MAMNDVSGKCRFSGSDSCKTLWPIFKKMHSWLHRWPHPTCKCWGQSVEKGACLHMREVVAFRRLFFSLLSLMRIATGRPVGPVNAVSGSNDASCCHSYSLDNKNHYFPFFTQKSEKFHYGLLQHLRAIIPAPMKIHACCLHKTAGFRGGAIEWCPTSLPLTDACCHGNQPPLFEHKIGNNSAYMGDTTPIPAPS